MDVAQYADGFRALGVDPHAVAELRFARGETDGEYTVYVRPAGSDAFSLFGNAPCTLDGARHLAAHCGLTGALMPLDEVGGLHIVRSLPPAMMPSSLGLMAGGARFD